MNFQNVEEDQGNIKATTITMHCSPGGLFAMGKLLSDQPKKRVKEVGFQYMLTRLPKRFQTNKLLSGLWTEPRLRTIRLYWT